MLGRFLPKGDVFFEYMERQAAKAVEAIGALRTLFEDLDNVGSHRDKIKAIEHQADAIAHEAIGRLHRTFVTPMDRNDINRMTKRLDDVVDLIESVAQRMYYYELTSCPSDVMRLVDLLEKQTLAVQSAVGEISDMRDSTTLKDAIVEIHTYENQADDILRPAIANLFRETPDTKTVIKWKEVYEHLERATDVCEDIADLIENILLEYA